MPLLARLAFAPRGMANPLFAARAAVSARGLALIAVVAALSIPVTGLSATPPGAVAQEYDLKAAFLFNFAQFVEWPTDAFDEASTPITIGVLGDDPFGASLDALVSGETIRSRRLLVRRYRSVEQVHACHILFVSSSEASQLDHIARALAHRSILTVGETKNFAAHAGIIGFELAKRRLRLQINPAAAAAARLTISSKLLRQARIVKPSGRRE